GAKDGIEYFTLASVGAFLDEELPPAGSLHHINVVTVRKDEFHVAAIPIGQTIDPREFTLERIEEIEQVAESRVERKSEPVRFEPGGSPGRGTYAVALTNPAARPIEVTLDAGGAGPVWLPDHQHFVIEPGKTQIAAFRYRYEAEPTTADFTAPGLAMQVEYLAETARIPLPVRELSVDAEFVPPTPGRLPESPEDQVLSLDGDGALRVESTDFELPDGPFTLEAWVNPSSIDGSRGVVAKTQNSEYAIFLHDGLPDFSVHLDGRYATAKADRKLEPGRWTHLAGVFTGDEVILFVDGESAKRVRASGQRKRSRLPLYLGADPGEAGERTRPLLGRIDEIRLSKVARYREAFEPQRRLEADGETVLHYDFDAAFGPFVVDDSEPFVPAKLDGEAHLVPRDLDAGE
ncbi:MAG TPA: LamG domain-containing protein, partial [Planctomycetaceae bacterium]